MGGQKPAALDAVLTAAPVKRVADGRPKHHIISRARAERAAIRGRENLFGVLQDARPLRGPGGTEERDPRGGQKRLSTACEEAASGRQQERQEGGDQVLRA